MSTETLSARCELLLREMQPGGLYGEIAEQLVGPDTELADAHDVVNVLNLRNQPTEAETQPRWQLLEEAKGRREELAGEYGPAIMDLAERIGTAAPETLPQASLAAIDPDIAVFIGEGAARAQGFVRPGILEAAIAVSRPESQVVNQLGSDRKIDSVYKGRPNDEHVVVRGYAPDFAAQGQQTEYANNIALAKQDGFKIGSWRETRLPSGLAVITSLTKANRPARECVMPTVPNEKGFSAGLSAMHSAVDLGVRQPVVATNGQYKLKDEIMLDQWQQEKGIKFGADPVVLGDQPGWRTRFNGQDVVTKGRPPLVHLGEAVVAARLLLQAV